MNKTRIALVTLFLAACAAFGYSAVGSPATTPAADSSCCGSSCGDCDGGCCSK